MDFAQTHPPLPSISRWFRLCRQYPGDSTIRKLEYEHLATLTLQGKLLDVGGGNNARYIKHLPADIQYHSVNIDPKIQPTWLVDEGAAFPVDDATFDCCISMNTLEHVYDPGFLVHEMHRVLKAGGQLHVTVPWMFRIHGHPDDFLRMTPSWWKRVLGESGFRESTITPMVWGRSSTGRSMTGGSKLSNSLAHIYDAMYAQVALRRFDDGKRRQRVYNVALGHFISAVK